MVAREDTRPKALFKMSNSSSEKKADTTSTYVKGLIDTGADINLAHTSLIENPALVTEFKKSERADSACKGLGGLTALLPYYWLRFQVGPEGAQEGEWLEAGLTDDKRNLPYGCDMIISNPTRLRWNVDLDEIDAQIEAGATDIICPFMGAEKIAQRTARADVLHKKAEGMKSVPSVNMVTQKEQQLEGEHSKGMSGGSTEVVEEEIPESLLGDNYKQGTVQRLGRQMGMLETRLSCSCMKWKVGSRK